MSKRIGSILTTIIPQEHAWKVKLLGKWESIIGNLAPKVRIEKINRSSLVLGVCHPTWAQELYSMTNMLKKKINATLQEEKIKTIHFKIVQFKTEQQLKVENRSPQFLSQTTKSRGQQEHCLNIMQHSHLQESVPNEELRHVLKRFYFRCKNTKLEAKK
ncbi:DUF721 domain-containing protein [Candidatus Babeliales bacterium]|nr:DUF721 domain-containing protein [Candidatus Babeliales bacterium]